MRRVKTKATRSTRRRREERRGVALIMVLVITTILSAVAADLQNGSQVNLQAAANARDELQAHFHARSALELELFLLRYQELVKPYMSFLPFPLFELSGMLVSSDTIKGIIDRDPTPKDEPRGEGLSRDEPFGDFSGSFWIEEVVDEARKINLNRPGKITLPDVYHLMLAGVFGDQKYDKFFETIGDSSDPIRNRIEIIANMTDWVDVNETIDAVTAVSGQPKSTSPEDTRYDHLPYNVRYKPKNARLTSLAELRMVPAVTDAFMQLFARFFTVWSDDNGVNMNTADPWMIQALIQAVHLPQQFPVEKEKMEKFMEEKAAMSLLGGGKMSKDTFVALLIAADINFDPQRLAQLEKDKAITFEDSSVVYRITTVGRVNDASSKITVAWRYYKGIEELRYWREE